MSEKRDLWVPLALLLAGLGLLGWHICDEVHGDGLTGVLAAILGIGGAVACLPLRLRFGQARVLTFGLGVALLLAPLVPGLAKTAAHVAAWIVAALAFLVPLRVVPQQTRAFLLGGAALFALLGLLAIMGVLPKGLTWLLLSGALYLAAQVFHSRPRKEPEIPPGPRVCMFGGSFDPFHRGHRALAEAALRVNDRLLVVVAGSAPHKFEGEEGDTDVTAFHHRVAMTRLGTSGLPRTEVLELEGRRDGPSYTIDTLDEISRSFPQGTRFRLMVGADMLQDFPNWKSWEEILERASLLVAARPGFEPDVPSKLAVRDVKPLRLEVPEVDLSSTQVRTAVAAGEDVGGMVLPAIRNYIDDHGLYRDRG